MIIVEVEKKQVQIPQAYNELSLSKWIKLFKIMCKYDLNELPTTDEGVDKQVVDEMELTKELVAELLQLTPKQVERLDMQQAEQVIGVFNNMLEADKFDGDWGGNSFEHKGETYYFPQTNFENMTFGEYATLKQYETVLAKEQDKRFDIIAEQMAYSCRKKDEKKESYNLKERAKLFEDVKMDIVLKLTFFLQRRIETLQSIIRIYSDKEKGTAPLKKLHTLSQDMGGSTQYTK